MLLIVDDDPAFLEAAERLLDQGRGVFFAGDARHAKELLTSVGAMVSVVLVDVDLPGGDGVSLIRELRQAFPDLPVIAITDVQRPDTLDFAKLLGATDALRKPINSEWNPAIARVRSLR